MQSNFAKSAITALIALVFGFLGAAIWSTSGLNDNRTRAYLLDNPEILNEMIEVIQQRDAADRLNSVREEVFTPFPGAVLGNPDGSKVLVEFTDYNCPYCEASLADVERLIDQDPDLKVIMREYPIFEGSEAASRMALAAGLQGKYLEFHRAMFRLGPATPESVEAAAKAAGLDLDRARSEALSDTVSIELARNTSLARQLGFNGTPAWVTGDRTINGAVGFEALKTAVDGAAETPG